jgi:hypothetical protein
LASFLLLPACDAAKTGKQHPNIELLPMVPIELNSDVGVVAVGKAYDCGERLVTSARGRVFVIYKKRVVPPMRGALLEDAASMAESIIDSPGSEDAGFFLYADWLAPKSKTLGVTLVLSVDKAVTLDLSNVVHVLRKKLFKNTVVLQMFYD